MLGVVFVQAACNTRARRQKQTFFRVRKAIEHKQLRAGTAVRHLLALGKPRRSVQMGPFTDYHYGFYSKKKRIGSGFLVRAYRGRLLLHRTTWSNYRGCGTHISVSRFDASTPRLRELYEFLDAQRTCGKNPQWSVGCVALANLLRKGQGTRRDLRRARRVLERTCGLGGASACAVLSDWIRRAYFGPPDGRAVRRYQGRSCHLGNASACTDYLKAYVTKSTAARVRDRWLRTSCRVGNVSDCRRAMRLALRRRRVLPRDRILERTVLRKCDSSDSNLCVVVARLVHRRRRFRIRRFPKGLRKRYHWYHQACLGGWSRGCRYAQRIRPAIASTLPSLAELRRLAKKSCGRYGCHTLGLMLIAGVGGKKDVHKGGDVLAEACMSQAWDRSCPVLARAFVTGLFGVRSYQKAGKYLIRGCLTNTDICRLAARHMRDPQWTTTNSDDERHAFEQACQFRGYAAACIHRASTWPRTDYRVYRSKPSDEPGGVKTSEAEDLPAEKLLDHVCFPGRMPACKPSRRSRMYQAGKWLPISRARALKLLKQTCQDGHAPSCRLHAASTRRAGPLHKRAPNGARRSR